MCVWWSICFLIMWLGCVVHYMFFILYCSLILSFLTKFKKGIGYVFDGCVFCYVCPPISLKEWTDWKIFAPFERATLQDGPIQIWSTYNAMLGQYSDKTKYDSGNLLICDKILVKSGPILNKY